MSASEITMPEDDLLKVGYELVPHNGPLADIHTAANDPLLRRLLVVRGRVYFRDLERRQQPPEPEPKPAHWDRP